MDHLETETAWLTAPASTRFHLCREEGLLEHSVNVAETMLKLKDTLAPDFRDFLCPFYLSRLSMVLTFSLQNTFNCCVFFSKIIFYLNA